MVPKTVLCDECGRAALVRSYGRIEYDWPETTSAGQVATKPTINSIRLTVDCPRCGVKEQEFCRNGYHSSTGIRPKLSPAAIRFRRR